MFFNGIFIEFIGRALDDVQRVVWALSQTGAEAVISGNIGCITQIQTHLQPPLPVWHTMQLLAVDDFQRPLRAGRNATTAAVT